MQAGKISDSLPVYEKTDLPSPASAPNLNLLEHTISNASPQSLSNIPSQAKHRYSAGAMAAVALASGAACGAAGLLGGGGIGNARYNEGVTAGSTAAAAPNYRNGYNNGYNNAWQDIGPLTNNYSNNSLSPVELSKNVRLCSYALFAKPHFRPWNDREQRACRIAGQVREHHLTLASSDQLMRAQLEGLLAAHATTSHLSSMNTTRTKNSNNLADID